MNICVGIDLGTTFSCISYINEEGNPIVIPNSDNTETTPSVIWFDGKAAFVGKKANDRKITPTSPIYEFVKRDIGKPKQINTRYEINGFYYGAAGMSAIILRKLKKDAFNFLKKKGIIASDAEEKTTLIPAVITVPAYFGDLQRNETKTAGFAAGWHVKYIINEPTAAAIAYKRTILNDKKILVFDLGGGTFDVTILKIENGDGTVIVSEGADQLGGKDWDEIIMEYLYSEYTKKTGRDIPDDLGWEVQQKAVQAKFDLTENEETTVIISTEVNDLEIPLYRADKNKVQSEYDFDMDENRPFYFEERSSNLLSLCRTICLRALEKSKLSWGDIDEIILAGGSCRMPMVPAMLEKLTGRKIPRTIPGFSYDTAISIGASVFGLKKGQVKDVTSKTIGLKLQLNGRPYIEHLIEKNRLLPVSVEKKYRAEYNAVLKVYEGESNVPDECELRGSLELGNPEGYVKVTMTVNEDGVLSSLVEYDPDAKKELQIKTDDGETSKEELKQKIQAIEIRL